MLAGFGDNARKNATNVKRIGISAEAIRHVLVLEYTPLRWKRRGGLTGTTLPVEAVSFPRSAVGLGGAIPSRKLSARLRTEAEEHDIVST